MPRTVLSIASTLTRCGPVNVLEGIVRHYQRAKYRAVIGTLSPERRDSRISEFRSFGVEVRQLDLSRLSSALIGQRKLRGLLDSVCPEIVHTHGARADILIGSLKLGCPTLSTVHADLEYDYKLTYGRRIGALLSSGEYAALKRFSAVAAVSEAASQAAATHGIRTEVIANGIDLHLYTAPMTFHEIETKRQSLGWLPHQIIVLHTGALIQRKRPLEVIGAFKRSKLSTVGRLIFVGEGPLHRQCQEAARNQYNISFMGQRTDIADLLRCADLLLSNSSSEGLPMALLEGCACGIPILASDISPHRRIATLFPKQVALFTSDEGLCTGLHVVTKRDYQTADASPDRTSSLEMISATRMSNAYQQLYDRLLRKA